MFQNVLTNFLRLLFSILDSKGLLLYKYTQLSGSYIGSLETGLHFVEL